MKGERAGLGHSAAEYFTVCVADVTCRPKRFSVTLSLTTPNTEVGRVPAGETIIRAYAASAVGGVGMKHCRLAVRFNVDAGHAYTVKLLTQFSASVCTFSVRDGATGAAVPVYGVPLDN